MRRHPCEAGVKSLTRNRPTHENGYQSNRVPSNTRPDNQAASTIKLPPGEWIEADTVAVGLGWTIGRLGYESRQLGIEPHRLPGQRRFYRASDVQRLNGGRRTSSDDFPRASREQPRLAGEIEYPQGYIAPVEAAKLMGVYVGMVKYIAAEKGIRVIKLDRSAKYLAYCRDDVIRAGNQSDWRSGGAR